MGEGETLPKTGKSKDWLAYADKKEQQFRDYHSERNLLGRPANPPPLSNDYSKLLSNNALQARKQGMELQRRELAGKEKGGTVRATGKRTLHKGEMVARKTSRTKSRGGRR
jgi:hypothetical protein